MKGRERSFEIHVQHRVRVHVPAPGTRIEAVGIDHSVTHAMTTFDTNGDVVHDHHRKATRARPHERARRAPRLRRYCRPGSRQWHGRRRQAKRLRARAANIRSHDRYEWSTGLAKRYDTVCCERMSVQSLVRTAHGTEESPGSRVAAKRGLSRERANAAPGEQRLALKAACERHWATFVETPARTSSTFCPVCRHRTGNNRKMASGVPVRQVRARRQHGRERGKEPPRPGRVSGPPGRGQGGAWGNPPKRPAGKQNRGSASKASGSNTPAHRRNPTRRPGMPPRTGSPSVSTTGTGARAMEAATRSENTASRLLR